MVANHSRCTASTRSSMGDHSTPLGVLGQVSLPDSKMRRDPGNNSGSQISSGGEAGQLTPSGNTHSEPDRGRFFKFRSDRRPLRRVHSDVTEWYLPGRRLLGHDAEAGRLSIAYCSDAAHRWYNFRVGDNQGCDRSRRFSLKGSAAAFMRLLQRSCSPYSQVPHHHRK
jgi:hypothetical protein